MVGVPSVFQHTPRSVTSAPPSAATWPTILAVLSVISVTDLVTTVGFSMFGSQEAIAIVSATINKDNFFITDILIVVIILPTLYRIFGILLLYNWVWIYTKKV